nr:reverse transcriptase domain-containing protein [Tanacetum cinerariifolium]
NKYVKDPVEIYNIKQKDGETIEDFIERFKVETGRIKGAPECMRISGFMHGEKLLLLAKRKVTHHGRHRTSPKGKLQTSWKAQDHSRDSRGSNRFTSLTRTPKEILAAEAGKFQPPPPMVGPSSSTMVVTSFSFMDLYLSTSTSTCLDKYAKLVDAILLWASAFLFLLRGTWLIEKLVNPLTKLLTLSRPAISASYPASLLEAAN